MVREAGLEPARPCEHWHLKPASLPIPPLARVVFGMLDNVNILRRISQELFLKILSFFLYHRPSGYESFRFSCGAAGALAQSEIFVLLSCRKTAKIK